MPQDPSDKKQTDTVWTEKEVKRLAEMAELHVPRQFAEEMVRFRRLGLKPPPEPKGPCLKGKEYDKYPNLPEDRIQHMKECLVCRIIIRCWPNLKKREANKPRGFIQKLRKFFKRGL